MREEDERSTVFAYADAAAGSGPTFCAVSLVRFVRTSSHIGLIVGTRVWVQSSETSKRALLCAGSENGNILEQV